MKGQKNGSKTSKVKNNKAKIVMIAIASIAFFIIGFGVGYLLSDNETLGGGFNASVGGGCTACKDGYTLSGGNCIKKTDQCSTIIAGCLKYDKKCNCTKCDKNYKLKNGTCITSCAVANCEKCDDQHICIKCAKNYELSNGRCVKSNIQCPMTEGCVAMDKNCNCGKCSSDYKLVDGVCKLKCDVANCARCSAANVCVICKDGYTLSNGKCVITQYKLSCKQGVSAQTVCKQNGYTYVSGSCTELKTTYLCNGSTWVKKDSNRVASGNCKITNFTCDSSTKGKTKVTCSGVTGTVICKK